MALFASIFFDPSRRENRLSEKEKKEEKKRRKRYERGEEELSPFEINVVFIPRP